MSDKQYLGDSVYVDIRNGMLILTTENGYPDDPSNAIFLEPEVYAALTRYVAFHFPQGEEKLDEYS